MRRYLWFLINYFAKVRCTNLIHKSMRSIFVIGDSHCWSFEMIPNTIQLDLGSITMHRIGRDKQDFIAYFYEKFSDRNKPKIKRGDVVVFSFGQIDANWHVWNQWNEKKRDLDEIIKTLVFQYLEVLKSLPYDDIVKIVFNVTPPSTNNYSPPYVGPIEYRVLISKKMNALLKEACPKYGCEFLDVYEEFANKRGILLPRLSDGTHHIHSKKAGALQRKIYQLLDKYPAIT